MPHVLVPLLRRPDRRFGLRVRGTADLLATRLESAGIHDILSKCLGTTNKHNVVNATIAALQMLRAPERVAAAREKSTDEIAVDYPVSAMASHAGEASSIVSGKVASPGGSAS